MANAKKLKDFIKLVSLNNNLKTFIIQPAENGIKVVAKSVDNTSMLVASFKGITITENLPVKDSDALMKALDFVGGEVVIEKKENKLFLSSNTDGKVKSREIGLVDEDFAKDTFLEAIPPFEYSGGVNVSLSDLKDMISQMGALDSGTLVLEVKEGEMGITVKGDTDSAKITTKVDYFNCKGYFGSPLATVVSSLQGDKVEIFMHQEKELYPIKISQKTDDFTFFAIVAPKEITEEAPEEKAPEQKEEEAKKVEEENGF